MKSGDVVQVIDGNHEQGALFVVDHVVDNHLVYVYQMGSTSPKRDVFEITSLAYVGKAAKVIPLYFHNE